MEAWEVTASTALDPAWEVSATDLVLAWATVQELAWATDLELAWATALVLA